MEFKDRAFFAVRYLSGSGANFSRVRAFSLAIAIYALTKRPSRLQIDGTKPEV